ncbi:MAG: S1/P1 nuclease [Gammaproteobacteria bacterium]|nr:S1/P1 nuclease [Gammaproteobacteria bacterium]
MINVKFTLFPMPLLRNLCLSIMLLLTPLLAFAWNSNAHRVIAEIAWDNLTVPARAQVGCLVQKFQHSWPRVRSFQQMATWPDTLKAQGVTAFNQWHFIAQPFSNDSGRALPKINDENGVWAVQQGMAVLMDGSRDPAMQAWFLAFVTHIVGDLHQPLHTITRVSRAHPQGDLGGNLFMIHYPGASNRHCQV